jgi:hypothetical protein
MGGSASQLALMRPFPFVRMPEDGNRVVDALVVPTTAGIGTVVCLARPEAALVLSGCDSIARSLSISTGSAIPLGPSAAFLSRLPRELERLSRDRTNERKAVEDGKPRAATRLARSHRPASGALDALAPSSDATATALVRSLAVQGIVYARLALALRRSDRNGAIKASQRLLARDEEIRLLVRRVGAGGGLSRLNHQR